MTKLTKPKMTESTLLEALRHAMSEHTRKGEGKTAAELAVESKMHITKVRHQLRILLDQKKCIVELECRQSIAGYMRPVPVYVLVK
jgi:hypothetical protein